MSKRMTVMPDQTMEQAPVSPPVQAEKAESSAARNELAGPVRSNVQRVLLPEDVELAARLARRVTESERLAAALPKELPSRYKRETGVEL